MSRRDVDVLAVQFTNEGLIITYMTPSDARADGNLVAQHQLAVSGAGYLEDLTELHTICQRVLRDFLDDFDQAPVYTPGPDVDDDEDREMGDRK